MAVRVLFHAVFRHRNSKHSTRIGCNRFSGFGFGLLGQCGSRGSSEDQQGLAQFLRRGADGSLDYKDAMHAETSTRRVPAHGSTQTGSS